MNHSPVTNGRGACIICGWPVKLVKMPSGWKDFQHKAPAPKR